MITPVEVLGKELRRGFGYKAVEVDEFLEELAAKGNTETVPEVDAAAEAAKELAEATEALANTLTQGFNVESGNGFINEIQQLGQANGVNLTDQQATDMYTQLMKGLSNDPSKLLEGGLDEVYTITDQPDVNGVPNIGIASPGQKQFTPEAARILAGLMVGAK